MMLTTMVLLISTEYAKIRKFENFLKFKILVKFSNYNKTKTKI